MDGIQSLDRGLAILKLLSEEGRITASFAASKLGIHQSSASRLLMSLQKAGLVRKPDFHSFAPDFGLLAFAGMALDGFPEAGASVEVCDWIARESGHCVAAATLFHGRLIYLARISPPPASSLTFVDDSRFPIYRSSLGLLLAYRLGERTMKDLLVDKMISDGVPQPETEAETLFQTVRGSVDAKGLLDLKGVGQNAFNYVSDFEAESGRFALALYDSSGDMPFAKAKQLLEAGVARLNDLMKRKSQRKGGAF